MIRDISETPLTSTSGFGLRSELFSLDPRPPAKRTKSGMFNEGEMHGLGPQLAHANN